MSTHFKIIESKQWHQDGSWVAIMGSEGRIPSKKINVSSMIANLKEKHSIFCETSPSNLSGPGEKWDDVLIRDSQTGQTKSLWFFVIREMLRASHTGWISLREIKDHQCTDLIKMLDRWGASRVALEEDSQSLLALLGKHGGADSPLFIALCEAGFKFAENLVDQDQLHTQFIDCSTNLAETYKNIHSDDQREKQWRLMDCYVKTLKVDINARSETWSALHNAAREGDPELAKYLVAEGIDINGIKDDGYTPLHSAVFNCNQEVAEFLLLTGARTDIKNKIGQTAKELLMYRGGPSSEAILKVMDQVELAKKESDILQKAVAEVRLREQSLPGEDEKGQEVNAPPRSTRL